LQEWLSYTTSELHKTFGGLFNPKRPAELRQTTTEALLAKFEYVSAQLKGRNFLLSSGFTVADAYLFVALSWSVHVGIDLSRFEALSAYQARISARPAVQAALRAEGLG
jgi:glutathione S-transferase